MTSASPPVVSVVLPAFNAAHTIRRAVASIQGQSFADWELLVIDDGSVDATRDIVADHARLDGRIRLVSQGHAGLVAALNAGLAAARGELIARMDADDESHSERLADQLAMLTAQPDIGLAACLVEFVGDVTASRGYALHVDWINSLMTPEQIALNRFVEAPFAHPSVMFRREVARQLGGYRAGDFPEDYELWLRWLHAGVRMAKVPRVLLRWHDSPMRLSRSDPRYHPEAFFRTKAEWIARWLTAERGRGSPVARNSIAQAGEEEASRPIYVWGAGRPTRKRAAYLAQHGVHIAAYIDVDQKKLTPAIGGTGARVIAPAELPPAGEVFVLGYVTSRGARELIRQELNRRGYVEGGDFLMCG